jgi:hypothetical protein
MLAGTQFRNIDTVTEFTIFSIERSEAGLDMLAENSRRAARALSDGDTNNGLRALQSLIGNLYDFRRFTRDVSVVFNMNLAHVGDAHGSFEDNAAGFRATLHSLSTALDAYDTAELARLLSVDLAASLKRFKEMLPLLRDRVECNMPGAA